MSNPKGRCSTNVSVAGRASSAESRAMQELRKENAALSKELSEMKSLHEQLLHEGSWENTLEKRVNILKSQIFQLERQVVLLSDVVSSYAGSHLELYSMLETMVEQLNSGNYSVDDMTKTARQLQGRLSKSNRGSLEKNALPLLSMKDFTNSSFAPKNAATILDVCSGKAEHVNMKRVGQLESKLAKLFGELIQLRTSLETTPTTTPALLQPMREHSLSQVTSCCVTLSECCHDLLCVSLLLPSAPWPSPRDKPSPPELSVNAIMKKMPSVLQNKKVREVVEGVCNYSGYLNDMNRIKCDALEQELQFHKSVYVLQVSYVQSLFDAVRCGYEKFESSMQNLLCKPLKEVLRGYDALSSTPTETALREFLKQVQSNVPQLRSAIDGLSPNCDQLQGTEAWSKFGEEFYKTLLRLEHSRESLQANT